MKNNRTKGEVFIENVQGLLIYCEKKNGLPVSIKQLLELDEATFNDTLEDFNENHNQVLDGYFKAKLRQEIHFFYTIQKGLATGESEDQKKIQQAETSLYLKNLVDNIPSKFQSVEMFGLMDHLLNELLDAAKKVKCQIPEKKPLIATISTNSVNACALKLDNGEAIIFVEEDLLSFIHLFSKIFVQCLSLGPSDDEKSSMIVKFEEIKKNIDEKPEILNRFKDFLTSYIVDGSPRKSEQYEIPQDARYNLCTYLLMSCEMFLIGHELGHIISGHLKHARKFGFFGQTSETQFMQEKIDNEFEADYIGMILTMQASANRGFQADFAYLGIEPFFMIYDVALKAKSILKYGHEDLTNYFVTHPSNNERMINTKRALIEISDEQQFYEAIYLPGIISQTIEYLWENSKSVFYNEFIKINSPNK